MSESTPIFYPKAALEQWLGKKAQQHSYSLEEFGELIKPTYQVYEEYIRRCVAGLTTVAAQRAVLHQFQKLIQVIRRLGGSAAKPMFQRGSGV